MILQQMVNGLMIGSMYAMIAIGYTLVFGMLNMLNMAHAEVFMIGGFIALFLITLLNLPLIPALIGTMILTGVLGILVEIFCFRFIKKEYPLAPMLSTMGFGLILSNLAINYAGSEAREFPIIIAVEDFQFGELIISASQGFILIITIILMVGLALFIKKTKMGRAMRAIAENYLVAQLLGVSVSRVITLTFFISASLAGTAGLFIGLRFGKIDPFLGVNFGMKGLAIMIIGGLGNVYGAMVLGVLVGLVEVFMVTYFSATYSAAAVWGLLIIILIFAPNGLFGSQIKAEKV
jgi:branched-chain amino acid transport system permease protein